MTITGALHLHSAYSYDAKLPLRDIRALAERRGMSFLCMTEHTDELTPETALAFVAACRDASDDTFVFIPGFEVDYGNNHTHVLMIGCRSFVSAHANAVDISAWKLGAALAVLAHPHRGGYRIDPALEPVLDGIEIWNAQYDGKRVPRSGARRMLKRLSPRLTLKAFAGWDFHRASHDGGPLVAVHVEKIDEDSILAALKAGNYLMRSDSVSIGSDGMLLGGSAFFVALESAFFTTFIAIAKVMNAALARIGLRLPKSAASYVRRNI